MQTLALTLLVEMGMGGPRGPRLLPRHLPGVEPLPVAGERKEGRAGEVHWLSWRHPGRCWQWKGRKCRRLQCRGRRNQRQGQGSRLANCSAGRAGNAGCGRGTPAAAGGARKAGATGAGGGWSQLQQGPPVSSRCAGGAEITGCFRDILVAACWAGGAAGRANGGVTPPGPIETWLPKSSGATSQEKDISALCNHRGKEILVEHSPWARDRFCGESPCLLGVRTEPRKSWLSLSWPLHPPGCLCPRREHLCFLSSPSPFHFPLESNLEKLSKGLPR